MEELEHWRLCDELTVAQAALLIAGYDPAQHLLVMYEDVFERPEKFTAALTALTHAIFGGRLPATLCNFSDPDWGFDTGETDWDKTTVFVEDLKDWLRSRGIESGFFFPQASETPANTTPGYLDPEHAHYAPKLAAAIAVWLAVDANPELTKGKTVKKAMKKWLEKNATQFKLLVKDDGTLNAEGIEETAKTANWDDKCGAPKTPAKRQT